MTVYLCISLWDGLYFPHGEPRNTRSIANANIINAKLEESQNTIVEENREGIDAVIPASAIPTEHYLEESSNKTKTMTFLIGTDILAV